MTRWRTQATVLVRPDASMVPLPAFLHRDIAAPRQEAVPVTAPSPGGWIDHRTRQRVERCWRVLTSSPPEEIRTLMQNITEVLLEEDDRTLSLTLLGARITETSRVFLRDRRLGIRDLLLCHMDDFAVQGDRADARVIYLHTGLKPDWHMFYEVTVSL
eukprot:TRINITY_DN13058_c0_g1_i1.p1 TRINITY_DN13058_c0_g1~~TRINITY_DN13058_c0_g1_i1.p1  ORF type:complete len:158 (+),score=7.01 TRINITY_DN13058_c0_g1_i1:103-576(+)